nr:plasmid SOS inhibition protein A [Aureimonas sp. AU4]
MDELKIGASSSGAKSPCVEDDWDRDWHPARTVALSAISAVRATQRRRDPAISHIRTPMIGLTPASRFAAANVETHPSPMIVDNM